ncbi:MAG: hypothetical protein IKV59_04210 [Lachnospiraceae bacterium]|nr:hypothetical protein [Lachnospiraceae bacterium]
MELDLEEIAILLQRRYNWLREVKKLTGEMQDSVSRHDEISFGLLLQMRAEVLAKYDASGEELWSQAERGPEALPELRRLLREDPDTAEAAEPIEKKIFELRKKTKILIGEIQNQDKMLHQRVNHTR